VEPPDYDRLYAVAAREIPRSQAVVLSGTLTPGGPVDFYARCVRLARESGVLSAVDAQGAPLLQALAEGPGLVKPNRPELAASVGRELPTESDVVSAMRELAARGARRVVVTDGPRPALALEEGCVWRVEAPRVRAVNPIGSGDAFTAGLVSRMVRGESLGEACRWGAASGAANALTLMAGELELAEVERLAREIGVTPLG
jgi:tagatose 6-phosphate kinase